MEFDDYSPVSAIVREIAPIVGLVFTVGSTAYVRGVVDGSPLTAVEYAKQATLADLLIPLVFFIVGMSAMLGWIMYEVIQEYTSTTAID